MSFKQSYSIFLSLVTCGENNIRQVYDKNPKGNAYRFLGNKYFHLGDLQKAIQYHLLDLTIAKEVGDRPAEGRAYGNLGIAYRNLGDCKKALEYQHLRLNIANDVGDRCEEGRAYGNLGVIHYSLGDTKKAIEYHQLHLDIAKEDNDRAGEGRAYANLGTVYNFLGDFAKSIEYHKLHLSTAKEMSDKAGEGRAYGNLGIAYNSLGEFEKSREYHELHISIAKEVGDRAGEARTYGNLGIVYRNIGNFKKAIQCHQLYLSFAQEVGDKRGEGNAYSNLGIAFNSLGNFQKAIEYHQLHLDIAKKVGDRRGEGRAYGNLGIDYFSLGHFKEAIKYHQLDLNIAVELGDRVGEGKTYTNIGIAYDKLGDFKKAIDYHELKLSIAKEMGDKNGQRTSYSNLGNAYYSLGDFQKAIAYHELDLSIAKEVGNRAAEGGACGNLGMAYDSLGDLEKAAEYYEQDLCIAKEVEDRSGEGRAYGNLGVVQSSLGKSKKAIEYHEQHIDIAKEIGDKHGEGKGYANLGIAYRFLGDIEKAMQFYHLDLSIAKEVGDRAGQGRAYANLGDAYLSLGDFRKAEEFYRSCVRLFENIRELLLSEDEWKISLRNQYKDPYTALWTVMLLQNKVSEALSTAERGRGQALMDLMASHYGFQVVPFESADDISSIFSYISSPTVFLAVDSTSINFWVLQNGKELKFLRTEIKDTFLQGSNAMTYLRSLNEKAYQTIGVLKKVMCENRSLDEVDSKVSGESPSRSRDVEGHTSSVYEGEALKVLSEVVISPISHLIQGDEVTIVPDGPLFLVPFAALLDQHSRYLSETLRIRLIPSLTSLKLMEKCPEGYHSSAGALLVGDPRVEGVRVRGKRVKQLPFAKKEVEMIGTILKSEPLTGVRATKAEVLSRLNSVALVHIAAHGCPETGEIILSPNPAQSKRPKEEDFVLTIADVLNANLQARLVVLSCCHSGRGDIKAEGVVGIGRAFLGAGARSVLVTLWAIDDKATLEFMRTFYEYLVDGQSASTSLNKTMKRMRASSNFSDVRYWAPFALIGDDVTLNFS